jgi:hypothetical protein
MLHANKIYITGINMLSCRCIIIFDVFADLELNGNSSPPASFVLLIKSDVNVAIPHCRGKYEDIKATFFFLQDAIISNFLLKVI